MFSQIQRDNCHVYREREGRVGESGEREKGVRGEERRGEERRGEERRGEERRGENKRRQTEKVDKLRKRGGRVTERISDVGGG